MCSVCAVCCVYVPYTYRCASLPRLLNPIIIPFQCIIYSWDHGTTRGMEGVEGVEGGGVSVFDDGGVR